MKLLKTVLTGLFGVWCILGTVLIFTGAVPLYCVPAIFLFVCVIGSLNERGGRWAEAASYLASILLSLAFPVAVYIVTSKVDDVQTDSRIIVTLIIFGLMGMLTMFSLLFSEKEQPRR